MTQKTSKPKPQVITLKISKVLLDQYDKILERKGINRSEAIRAYMVDYIEKNSK